MYKKNKIMFVLTIIAVVCILIILIGIFTSFYKKSGTSEYGDRLDDIKGIELSSKVQGSLEDFYEDEEKVKSANVDVKGKIVYLIIDVDEGTTISEAQKIAIKGLDEFSKEELEVYDLQFILTCSAVKDSKSYPTMGYKNNNNAKVVWINRN